MNKCNLCKGNTNDDNLCKRCKLSTFQVLESLETYLKEEPPPNWLLTVVRDIGWIYQFFPRTKPYFDVAHEIAMEFVICNKDSIPTKDVKMLARTHIPENKIVSLLEEAHIVEQGDRGKKIYPGKLTKKLKKIKWEGYEANSPQFQWKNMEKNGILTIAMTKSLLDDGSFIPRKVLAMFHMLSLQMLKNEEDGIFNKTVTMTIQRAAFGTLHHLTKISLTHQMLGFYDGLTKFMDDADENGNLILKEGVKSYMENMWERWRERERTRDREGSN